MDLIELSTLPKYTQYELSALVESKINEMSGTPSEFAELFNISKNVLSDILGKQVVFKSIHYKVASEILGIPIDELLSQVDCSGDAFFRSKEGDDTTEDFIRTTKTLFAEWIFQQKTYGQIQ